jgi:hypothetical protein
MIAACGQWRPRAQQGPLEHALARNNLGIPIAVTGRWQRRGWRVVVLFV